MTIEDAALENVDAVKAGCFESLDPSLAPLQSNAIVYSWDVGKKSYFLMFFALVWNGVVAAIIYTAAMGNAFTVNGVPYASVSEALVHNKWIFVFLLFPLIGFFLAYWILLQYVNSSKFYYSDNEVRIKRGPLPWKKTPPLRKFEVRSVYFEIYTTHEENDYPIQAHRVVANLRTSSIPLVVEGNMPRYEAEFLAFWISRKLQIPTQEKLTG